MIRDRVLLSISDLSFEVASKIEDLLKEQNIKNFLLDMLSFLEYCCSVWVFRPFHFYLYFYHGIAIVGKPSDY